VSVNGTRAVRNVRAEISPAARVHAIQRPAAGGARMDRIMPDNENARAEAVAFLKDSGNAARLHRATQALLDQLLSCFCASAAVVGPYARPADGCRAAVSLIESLGVCVCRLLSESELQVRTPSSQESFDVSARSTNSGRCRGRR
jgi:hypothetical protein